MDGQEVRVLYGNNQSPTSQKDARNHKPIRNDRLARSASSARPKGVTNGDFALRAAAIVSAGSKHLNNVAINRNLPRWTSVGSWLSRRPIGVISSEGVNALT